MSEPDRTPSAEPQPVNWAFLNPMAILFVAGSFGVVYGKIREGRVVPDEESKQEALRKEIASKESTKAPYTIPYDLEQPDWFRLLPLELNEISGFTVNEAGDGGWAVNDEIGALYPFALVEGLVGKPFEFAGRGDYEGIEIVGNEVVVARSDGKLLRVRRGSRAMVHARDCWLPVRGGPEKGKPLSERAGFMRYRFRSSSGMKFLRML